MAPDIKKIKPVLEIPQKSLKSAVKVTDRSASKPKRKATDDASPITLKKAKSAKQTSTKPTGQIAKKDEVKKMDKKKSAQKQNDSAASESLDFEAQADNDVLLLADELDSGDDVATPSKTVAFKPGQDVGKVPATPKDAMKKEKSSKGQSGVVYIGRIPHGFYEYEMRQYLSQFGPVSRIRLSRNKKTGASKHFAFVEFEDEDTAEIVAKTMDNYLLFGHILKVKMVPKSEIHEELFKGANRRYKKVPWNRLAGKQLANPKTETTWEVKVERERASRARKAHKLNALGYEFSATNLKDVPRAASLKAHGATEEDILATTLEQGDSGVVTKALMPIRKEQDAGVAAETATVSQKTAVPIKVSKSGKREKRRA